MDSLQFMYRSLSSASVYYDTNVLMICATVRMAPLFGGSGESLDMENAPPRSASGFCFRQVGGVAVHWWNHVTGAVGYNFVWVCFSVI